MKQPRHIYTLTGAEFRRYTEHFRNAGVFSVVHEHRKEKPCWGDCPVLNMPDDLEDQLNGDLDFSVE